MSILVPLQPKLRVLFVFLRLERRDAGELNLQARQDEVVDEQLFQRLVARLSHSWSLSVLGLFRFPQSFVHSGSVASGSRFARTRQLSERSQL
jgi:hypothetical protein